jgi:hypothetical protein
MREMAIHVTLAGSRAGDYLVEKELPDGRLVLRPDPSYPTDPYLRWPGCDCRGVPAATRKSPV